MYVNNLPKVATQWNSGTVRESNRGHRAGIPSVLTPRPLSHTAFCTGLSGRLWDRVMLPVAQNVVHHCVRVWMTELPGEVASTEKESVGSAGTWDSSETPWEAVEGASWSRAPSGTRSAWIQQRPAFHQCTYSGSAENWAGHSQYQFYIPAVFKLFWLRTPILLSIVGGPPHLLHSLHEVQNSWRN